MPKMTRGRFIAGTTDMWRLAESALLTRGMVYGTVIALDAMGRQQIFMQVTDDGTIASAGAIAVPGPFIDHLDMLREMFREHKAVAALMYAEAWTAKDETLVETLRMDIPVHEHPMKDELLFTVGFWPRECVARGHQAFIDRDERGRILGLRDHEDHQEGSTRLMFSWLADLLPRP